MVIDLRKPRSTPLHDPVSHLVYAVQGSDVCTTIIDGKPVMLDYRFLTVDVDEVLLQATEAAKTLTNSS